MSKFKVRNTGDEKITEFWLEEMGTEVILVARMLPECTRVPVLKICENGELHRFHSVAGIGVALTVVDGKIRLTSEK
jgi:hypothetical protein